MDTKVYLPNMRFPLESPAGYANSQVWGTGGSQGPSGSQCAATNYSYPWRDNFCESRTHSMPLCPATTGHQGQDIRPNTCQRDTHWAVAAIAGTVTNVGSYSVYVTADDGTGTRTDYLHMSSVAVTLNQKVTAGQRLGKVADVFGGESTTIHLHFNIRQTDATLGFVFVPPYMSLVEAYRKL
ncbi:MAG TPA: M23 family metallopeptidase [Vicinamibacterales bacterium]|nr:M23 family metallopeptidase [Vicinamibacterales bacterium]